jgi:heme A synthase
MYTGIKHLHSTLAYVLLAGLLISFLYIAVAYVQNKKYNRKMALLGFITAHLQLLVGLIAYFVSPLGIKNLGGDAMKDSIQRLYSLEHPLMMLIAITLITVGYIKAKKATTDKKANGLVFAFYGIALLLVLSRIPWHVWPSFMIG